MFKINTHGSVIYLKSFKIIFIYDYQHYVTSFTISVNKLQIIYCRSIFNMCIVYGYTKN